MYPTLIAILILGSSFVACNDGPPVESEGGAATPNGNGEAIQPWEEPPNYSFMVRSRCGEQNFIGTFQIDVADGEVVEATGQDERARTALKYMKDDVPTLDDLVGYALEAESSGADLAEVTYDEDDGHPRRIDIDYDTNAIDDESCFVITDYRS